MKSFITGLMRHRNNYRQLDPGRIVETIEGLQSRIDERFPGAGLGRLVADLRAVADETVARTAWIQKPHLPLRVAAGTLAVVIVALFMSLVLSYHELRLTEFSNIIQVLDSGISAIVYVGAAILFLITWETRIKRARALRALHELRSLAHIVDMHQLTKDPERAFGGANDTASSPHRPLTPFELSRYLDYCAEALALIGKIAALYAQHFQDAVVLDAVDDMEDLTTGFARKIWQKIALIDFMQRSGETPPGAAV